MREDGRTQKLTDATEAIVFKEVSLAAGDWELEFTLSCEGKKTGPNQVVVRRRIGSAVYLPSLRHSQFLVRYSTFSRREGTPCVDGRVSFAGWACFCSLLSQVLAAREAGAQPTLQFSLRGCLLGGDLEGPLGPEGTFPRRKLARRCHRHSQALSPEPGQLATHEQPPQGHRSPARACTAGQCGEERLSSKRQGASHRRALRRALES